MTVTQKTLMQYIKKINFGTEQKLPMSQGMAIKTVIDTYKIPAIKWGFDGSLIGIETKKQIMVWRDKGSCLEFLGLMNKEAE
jgi:hypothetical protein